MVGLCGVTHALNIPGSSISGHFHHVCTAWWVCAVLSVCLTPVEVNKSLDERSTFFSVMCSWSMWSCIPKWTAHLIITNRTDKKKERKGRGSYPPPPWSALRPGCPGWSTALWGYRAWCLPAGGRNMCGGRWPRAPSAPGAAPPPTAGLTPESGGEYGFRKKKHEDTVTKKAMIVIQPNLKLKTFCSRRLNSDSKASILKINMDAKLFVFINIWQLAATILTAWRSCWQQKRWDD